MQYVISTLYGMYRNKEIVSTVNDLRWISLLCFNIYSLYNLNAMLHVPGSMVGFEVSTSAKGQRDKLKIRNINIYKDERRSISHIQTSLN